MKHLHFAYRYTEFIGSQSFVSNHLSVIQIDAQIVSGRCFMVCLFGHMVEIFIHWRRYDYP
jgi:hypothetical protein